MYVCICDFKTLDRWESARHKRFECEQWDKLNQHQRWTWQYKNTKKWRRTITVTRKNGDVYQPTDIDQATE